MTVLKTTVNPEGISARINILKLIFIFPIIAYHTLVGLIGVDTVTNEPRFQTVNTIIHYMGNEFFGCFGYFVTALSFFTYGYYFDVKKEKRPVYNFLKYFVLVAAFLSSQLNLEVPVSDNLFWSWNLYSFILVSYLTIMLLKKYFVRFADPLFYVFIFLFSVSPLLNPFLQNHFNWQVLQAFIPMKLVDQPNSWFLFPWLFGVYLFFVAGVLIKKKSLSIWHLAALGTSLVAAIIYYTTAKPFHFPFSLEIDAFYVSFFWQHTSLNIIKVFSFSLFLILLCIRTLPRLETNMILSKLRYLQWCQHFWFCYVLHLGIKDALAEPLKYLLDSDLVLSYSWVMIFFATEFLAQWFFFALKFYRFVFFKLFPKLGGRVS